MEKGADPGDIRDGFDVGGKGGQEVRMTPRLRLGHWVGGGAHAQIGTTRGNRLPSPPHPPDTVKPSSPCRTGPARSLLQEMGVGAGAGGHQQRTASRPTAGPPEGGDQPRQGPSGFKARSGLPRERGSASSRLNLPRRSGAAPAPQPAPEAPTPQRGAGIQPC